MQTSTPSGRNPAIRTQQTHSPSVPMSVYRQLAAELQTTKGKLEALNAQNQNLSQENQRLRQEIEKAVQSVLHLQRTVNTTANASHYSDSQPTPNYKAENKRQKAAPRPAKTQDNSERNNNTDRYYSEQVNQGRLSDLFPSDTQQTYYQPTTVVSTVESFDCDVPEEMLYTEEAQVSYRYSMESETPSRVNGFWLAIGIMLIIVTAFGAGYLFVRPILQRGR